MFSDPLKNIKTLELRENDIVADLGAGTGFYSVAAGRLVPKGKVYAVEIVKDFLSTIRNKVRDAHLSNVEIIHGDVEKLGGTKIGNNVLDAVIVSNVLFQVKDKEVFIEEIKRILKPKGKVLFIDWSERSMMGAKVISKMKALELFERKDFIIDREINAGAHHYGIILIRK